MRWLDTLRLTLVSLGLAVSACDGRDGRAAPLAAGDDPGRSPVGAHREQGATRPATGSPDTFERTPGLPEGAKSRVVEITLPVEVIAGGRIDGLTVKETETELRLLLAADVLFAFDKAELRPEADATLSQAADLIGQRGVSLVRIEGHTDSKGSPTYNQRLSQRRAESVRRSLAARGLSRVTFQVQGFGATRPAAPNARPDGSDDPEGRARNRRVEVIMSTAP